MSLNDFLEPKLPVILFTEDNFMPLPPKNWGLNLSYQNMQELKGYYHRLLCDCNLRHRWEADDILSLVQEKANKANRLECPIKHPVAWAKKVGERIIFQQRRKEISEKKYVHNQTFSVSRDNFHCDDSLGLLVLALNELKQIKPDFHQLIVMRFFHELSWEKISLELYPDTTITKTIIDRERKKGSRALKKLREIFFSKLEKL